MSSSSAVEVAEGTPPPAQVTDDDNVKEDVKEELQEPDISLEILPLIKEAQSQHGLRHGDYQRYRMYCSRRLRRIRKSLHFVQGHRNRFNKKPVTIEKVTDARYLCIELVCAERDWATAMELKQAANTEPRKKFHLLRRLGRGRKHATYLSQLCEECVRCDARTRLEAQAYRSWMGGAHMFELLKWQEALQAFGQSRTIYERLSSAVSEEQKAVYLQRVEEISPNIRYCAYNIGDMPTDINQLMEMRNVSEMVASNINLVLAKTQEKAATSLSEVQWLGKKVPVKSEKVRLSLVKLQLVEGELARIREDSDMMEAYEGLLMEVQDALQLVQQESTELAAKEKRTMKMDVLVGHLKSIMDYLSHMKITHAIHRNLLLLRLMKSPGDARKGGKGGGASGGRQGQVAGAGKASKPQDFVRVYDILLQYVSELGDLLGQSDDLARQKETMARTFALKAFRCFYLAESYVTVKKWEESMSLFDCALQHVSQSLEHYREKKTEAEDKIDKAILPDLVKLSDTIRGRKCEVHVESVLAAEPPPEEALSKLSLSSKPLTERLDEFTLSTSSSAKPTLATFPPSYRPIPSKPLFFDLALNRIEYPSLDHKVEKKTGGITGFVKGLFWGKQT